jgi:hypothetical protein
MHARLVIFKLGPGQRSTIQALAESTILSTEPSQDSTSSTSSQMT